MDLYAWLNLSEEEERSMWDWHLLPHKRGHDDSWWDTFREKQRLIKEQPPDILAAKQRIQRGLNAKRGVGGALRSLRGRRTLIGDVGRGSSWLHEPVVVWIGDSVWFICCK
jgi:hypothetical protein